MAPIDTLVRKADELERLLVFDYPVCALTDALRDEQATIRTDREPATMSWLGVRATCTEGLPGIFRNWIAAVRRRAEAEGAGA